MEETNSENRKRLNFKDLFDHSTSYVIEYVNGIVGVRSVEQNEGMLKHFYDYVYKEIFKIKKKESSRESIPSFNDEYPDSIKFMDVRSKLKLFTDCSKSPEKKQVNKTLFLKGNSEYAGDYIVKKYFTEGIQYVQPNTKHVYKTKEKGKGLDLYIAKPDFSKKHQLPENCFYEYFHRRDFHRVRILPGHSHDIPPSSYYLVIAPCHTFFRKIIDTDVDSLSDTDRIPTEPYEPHLNGHFEISSDFVKKETESQRESDRNSCKHKYTSLTSSLLQYPHISARFSESSRVLGEPSYKRMKTIQKLSTSSDSHHSDIHISSHCGDIRQLESPRSARRGVVIHSTDPGPSGSNFDYASPGPSRNGSNLNSTTHGSTFTRYSTSPRDNTVAEQSDLSVFGNHRDVPIQSYRTESFLTLESGCLSGILVLRNEHLNPHLIVYDVTNQIIQETVHFKNLCSWQTSLKVNQQFMDSIQLRPNGQKLEDAVTKYILKEFLEENSKKFNNYKENAELYLNS